MTTSSHRVPLHSRHHKTAAIMLVSTTNVVIPHHIFLQLGRVRGSGGGGEGRVVGEGGAAGLEEGAVGERGR